MGERSNIIIQEVHTWIALNKWIRITKATEKKWLSEQALDLLFRFVSKKLPRPNWIANSGGDITARSAHNSAFPMKNAFFPRSRIINSEILSRQTKAKKANGRRENREKYCRVWYEWQLVGMGFEEIWIMAATTIRSFAFKILFALLPMLDQFISDYTFECKANAEKAKRISMGCCRDDTFSTIVVFVYSCKQIFIYVPLNLECWPKAFFRRRSRKWSKSIQIPGSIIISNNMHSREASCLWHQRRRMFADWVTPSRSHLLISLTKLANSSAETSSRCVVSQNNRKLFFGIWKT